MAKFSYAAYVRELANDAKLVDRAVQTIRKTVKLHGPRLVQTAVSAIKRVDRGTYRRAFKVDDVDRGCVLYNFAPHAPIIEEGRRPGARMPPVSAILEWVRRKKIGTTFMGPVQKSKERGERNWRGHRKAGRALQIERQQRWIAMLIARRIKARGLPGYHIVSNASDVLDRMVRFEMGKLTDQAGK